jgi:hypothetical protein
LSKDIVLIPDFNHNPSPFGKQFIPTPFCFTSINIVGSPIGIEKVLEMPS